MDTSGISDRKGMSIFSHWVVRPWKRGLLGLLGYRMVGS